MRIANKECLSSPQQDPRLPCDSSYQNCLEAVFPHIRTTMCYYKLHVFLHCGHSTFSDLPVGFCKAAKDVTVRFSGSRQRSQSTTSNSSSVYSRTDSMWPEEPKERRPSSTSRALRPCNQGQIHPLQSRRLERLCAVCQLERDKRLEALESLRNEICFEPWRWQFKYQGACPTQRKEPPNSPYVEAAVATASGVATTMNSLVTGGSGWIKDWKRQEACV